MPNPAFKRTHSVVESELKERAKKVEKGDCSEHWIKKMKCAFHVLDPNNTGYIGVRSFANVAESVILHSGMDSGNADELRSMLDTWARDSTSKNADAKINFEEFWKTRYILVSTPELWEDFRGHLTAFTQRLFKVIDTNHDNFISRDEWKVLYKCLGVTDEKHLNESFKVLDENQDGLISQEEFQKGSIEYYSNMEKGKYDVMLGPLPDVA